MLQPTDQQQRNVENIAKREGILRQSVDEQRYLTSDHDQQEQQSRDLGKLGQQAKGLVRDIVALLNETSSSANWFTRWATTRLHRWKYAGSRRNDLRKHLVNAALMQLEIHLLKARADSNLTWFEEAADVPDSRGDVRKHTRHFADVLRAAPISLSALNLHTIATALRAWSDELSVPATGISGWLEAAIPVSRDLRYLANYYHTRWLWKCVTDSHTKGGQTARIVILIKALFDSAFRVLSGYGLRGRRFIGSLIVIVLLFAAGFYAVDIFSGCNAWIANWWVNIVASVAYLVGDGPTAPDAKANASCPSTSYIFGAIGVVETGVGYLLLGIFVSLLYAVIQRRSIDTSRLALRHLSPSQPASVTNVTEQESVRIEANMTVQANTQINNATIDPAAPPDTPPDALPGVAPE